MNGPSRERRRSESPGTSVPPCRMVRLRGACGGLSWAGGIRTAGRSRVAHHKHPRLPAPDGDGHDRVRCVGRTDAGSRAQILELARDCQQHTGRHGIVLDVVCRDHRPTRPPDSCAVRTAAGVGCRALPGRIHLDDQFRSSPSGHPPARLSGRARRHDCRRLDRLRVLDTPCVRIASGWGLAGCGDCGCVSRHGRLADHPVPRSVPWLESRGLAVMGAADLDLPGALRAGAVCVSRMVRTAPHHREPTRAVVVRDRSRVRILPPVHGDGVSRHERFHPDRRALLDAASIAQLAFGGLSRCDLVGAAVPGLGCAYPIR